MRKIKVMIFIGHYLPGFKSGGILRSLVNLESHLHDEFDFWIITRDHDLGNKKTYPHIERSQWQKVGKSHVYYLDSQGESLNNICKLINDTQFDLIYLNSFFEPLSVKVLFANRTSRIAKRPIILSPRGEFSWASLKIKYIKKLIYIIISKLFQFYSDIIWHASSEYEKKDILNIMKFDSSTVRIARDLPVRVVPAELEEITESIKKDMNYLNIVFLSRISPEKNLDYALLILSKVQARVVFDIYGTTEDESYWRKCQKLISKLPANVTVNYWGVISPDISVKTLARYDLFFFPSGGENYGHVIAESLLAGTPVLISQNTPWLELEEKGIGWDLSLDCMDSFVYRIEKMALMSQKERKLKRIHIRECINEVVLNQQDYEDNKNLFLEALSKGRC